jgi:hypothetical protein
MNKYFNILRYGLRNIYNKKIKSYSFNRNSDIVKESLLGFINNIQSDTIVAFVGLKQIKYHAGIENPAEYMIELLQRKFKNIIVPTFSASVKVTNYFDVKNTSSDSGAFSNAFLKVADYRAPSPFKSFAIKGPILAEIEQLQFDNDFAPNGIFEFINKNNIPSVNIGTLDIRPICIHYSEYLKNVPYAIIETKKVKIIDKSGNLEIKNTAAFSYKMNFKVNRDKINKDLIRNSLITEQIVNGICLRYIPEDGYFPFFLDRISKNPYYLIE